MAEEERETELPLTEHDDVTHWVGKIKTDETVSGTKEHARGKGKPSSNQHVHQRSSTGHKRS